MFGLVGFWGTKLMGTVQYYQVLVLFIVVLLVALFVRSIRNRPRLPGPFPWPVFGNSISLGDSPHLAFMTMGKKYGPVFLIKLGGVDVVVLNDHQSIHDALVRQRRAYAGRPPWDSFGKVSRGKGIVFNDKHNRPGWHGLRNSLVRALRKFVTTPATRTRLERNVQREAYELVQRLATSCRAAPDRAVDPDAVIKLATANIACAMVFGKRYEHDNQEFRKLISMNQEFGDVIGAGQICDVMPWVKVLPSFARRLKIFDQLCSRMIGWVSARAAEHRRDDADQADDLAHLLCDERDAGSPGSSPLSAEDGTLQALYSDVFGASQDTFGTSITWIIAYLINYPDLQREIQQQIDKMRQASGGDLPSVDDLDRLPLLSAFIHEVYRHCTFASLTIPHMTLESSVVAGHHIPANQVVFINQYGANHDAARWPEPDQFLPARFLTADGDLVERAADQYLMFSKGARKCPGEEISHLMTKMIMASCLSVCTFEQAAAPVSLDGVYGLTVHPPPYRVRVRVDDPAALSRVAEQLQQNVVAPPPPRAVVANGAAVAPRHGPIGDVTVASATTTDMPRRRKLSAPAHGCLIPERLFPVDDINGNAIDFTPAKLESLSTAEFYPPKKFGFVS